MQVVYRISPDKPTGKQRPEWFSKQTCWRSFLRAFGMKAKAGPHLHLITDKMPPQQTKELVSRAVCPGSMVVHDPIQLECANGAEAFLRALGYTLGLDAPDSEVIYLVEDDYLHLPGAPEAIHEGLGLGFDYVTLYDHPDKYLADSPNPYVAHGSEATRLYLSPSCHWKTTNSTTMTFACRLGTLRKDAGVMYEINKKATVPRDFVMFCRLRDGRGRRVASAVPGLATHCESKWLAPLVDWKKVCRQR